MGTAAVVHAMGKGLRTLHAVLIAAPARYADYAAGFAAQAGLDAEQPREMIAALAELGCDVASVATPVTATRLTQRALLCHSNDDRTVPVRDGLEIAAAWRGAQELGNGIRHGKRAIALSAPRSSGRLPT